MEDRPSCWLIWGENNDMCTLTGEISGDLHPGECRSRITTQPGRTSIIPEGLCQSFCSAQDLLLLPGFVSQSGKGRCSSWVGAAFTLRTKQKPQWSLLWYFPCPIKGVWIDLFTSQHRVRTHGLGHKEGLVHNCWGASLLLGKLRMRQHLSCSCGTHP